MEQIRLWNNKIKYIGTEVFNYRKLNFVHLEDNICVNKRYYGIFELKIDIKMKCKNPNEVPTTTTQNPMEVKLIELQEQITKLEKKLRESKQLQKKVIQRKKTNYNEFRFS